MDMQGNVSKDLRQSVAEYLYSACTTWGVWSEKSEDELFRMMLLSSWRGRIGYPDLRARAQRLAKDYL
jgi:hypothetical protein